MHSQWRQISQLSLPLPLSSIVLPGVCIYSLSFYLMGIAWHHMLSRLYPKVTLPVSFWIFSRTQIGKYLPGNLFHYAGRQLLGNMCGIPHHILGAVSTSEIFFQVFSSSMVACLGAIVMPIEPEYRIILLIGAGLVFLFLILILYAQRILKWAASFSLRLKDLINIRQVGRARYYLFPLSVYCLHLILIGLLIGYISCRLGSVYFSFVSSLQFIVIYTISWTMGFVTPGSPGGIGVREALLVTQLSPILGSLNAVIVALCLRFAAILGDAVLFLTSYWIPKPIHIIEKKKKP